MKYIEEEYNNLFGIFKMMLITTIFVEFAILKEAIQPISLLDFISLLFSYKVYIEHIVVSLVFICLGALILLRKRWFLCKLHKNKLFKSEYSPLKWIKNCQVESWKFIFFYKCIFGSCIIWMGFSNFSTGWMCGKVLFSTLNTLQNQ